MASEDDWASYARAVVDFVPPDGEPFRLVPDRVGAAGRWPDGLDPPVVVVTAWNPDGVLLPSGDNRANNQRLVAELARLGLTYWPAVGRDLDSPHFEEGVAVPGFTVAEGVALGLRHGQAAIYVWTPDDWSVVSCTDERRHTCGWRRTGRPPSTT
jgi:hypothetical protein